MFFEWKRRTHSKATEMTFRALGKKSRSGLTAECAEKNLATFIRDHILFLCDLCASAVKAFTSLPRSIFYISCRFRTGRDRCARLSSRAHYLLDLHVARPGHARLFQFFLLLALKGFFNFVHRGRHLARRTSIAASTAGDHGRRASFLRRQVAGHIPDRATGSAGRSMICIRYR